jgi:DNA polymerase-3 subunit alpha
MAFVKTTTTAKITIFKGWKITKVNNDTIFVQIDNPFEKAYTILQDYDEVQLGEKCVIVGVVSKVLKKKTKNGQQFAFMDVYSNNGVIEVVLWANTLKKFQDLVVKGQQVAVLGKKDGDDKMIADKLKPYDQWLTDVTRKLNRNKF